MERRLAAILAADVVGYSRLMGADEATTLAALKACETSVIEPTVAANNGRIVKRMGDGFLVEFASAVDAVQCALDWQAAAQSLDKGLLRFRIGVNLGDIIYQDGDIYGDGVNVAARLEGLAETDGVCIAAAVHDQIRRRIDTQFRDLGEQSLKNIDESVHVFGWSPAHGKVESAEAASVIDTALEPAMLLVVPFRALGADTTAKTLCEALTENIAVALSHFDELTILDPSAVPADADIASGCELGRKLRVLYLLEGRVQAAGDRIRVSAQIVEVESGQRHWSDSFDREIGDIFALQDDLTAIVASTVGEALLDLLSKALDKKPEADWTARELTFRGVAHLHRMNRDQALIARDYFQQALNRDPALPLAVVCECWTYALELMRNWPLSRDDALEYCTRRAEELLALNERQSQVHRLLARLRHMAGDHVSALAHANRAYELNPYDSDIVLSLGHSLAFTGQIDRGVELVERAVSINPYAPEFYNEALTLIYAMAGRYEDALATLEKSSKPSGPSPLVRAACLVLLDRVPEAKQVLQPYCATHPHQTVERYRQSLAYQGGPDLDRFLDALKTAGLPSESEQPRPEKDAAHPDKPSIAVLPFENMSGDPKQEYFSDGISEDIIAGLSRCRSLTVIARTSSFTYKQTSVDARQMSQELGVRYLVEGSVRRSGESLRVAVQLIDGQTAGNLWSERYDRELADIFAVQDEITASILGTLLPEIATAEAVRVRRTPPNQLDAWALYHRGRDLTYKYSKEDNQAARSLFKRAIETDNSFASAHAGLAFANFLAVHDDYTDHPERCIEDGLKAAREAVRLDGRDEVAHMALGRILTLKKLYDEAVAASDASIELNPSYAPAHFGRAYALTLAGRAPESLASFETAIGFSPRHPNLWAFQCVNAWAHIQCGNREEANRLAVQASLHLNANFWAPATLAATLVNLGKLDEAHNALHEAIAQKPDLSLAYIGETLPFRDDGVRDAIFGILTDVGLPMNSAT
jgi:adenylate cyclase